jgi:hypothetical protein
MATQSQIWQVARLLGQDEFLSCLSLSTLADLHGLDSAQLSQVRQCTRDNANKIARALVHEAASRDDVVTQDQAERFLEEKLATFGDLLLDETKDKISEGFQILTAAWGQSK